MQTLVYGGPLLPPDHQADLCYLQTLRLTSDTSRTLSWHLRTQELNASASANVATANVASAHVASANVASAYVKSANVNSANVGASIT
jgi:hypothetical protein